MNKLSSGCSYSTLWVSPVDWKTTTAKSSLKKSWYIQCYFFDPEHQEKYPKGFQFRKKLNKFKTLEERRAAAEVFLKEIPLLFSDKGFNPITKHYSSKAQNSDHFTDVFPVEVVQPEYEGLISPTYKLADCLDQFLLKCQKKLEDKVMRLDTIRAYKSYIVNLKAFLKKKHSLYLPMSEYKRTLVFEFLDHIYYDRGNSPTTRNNYLQFLVNVGNHFVDMGYIDANPALAIKRLPENEKVRVYIPLKDRQAIKEYMLSDNLRYHCLAMLTYFCLIRRTEITKLKVGDLKLRNCILLVESSTAKKSKKEEAVTVPKPMMDLLIEHLKDATNDMYLFSADGYAPGKVQLKPKKISDEWKKMVKKLQLPDEYQFYSLKDTGITDLLDNGVPSYKVQKHARHSELSMTEKYINRKYDYDAQIFNAASF